MEAVPAAREAAASMAALFSEPSGHNAAHRKLHDGTPGDEAVARIERLEGQKTDHKGQRAVKFVDKNQRTSCHSCCFKKYIFM